MEDTIFSEENGSRPVTRNESVFDEDSTSMPIGPLRTYAICTADTGCRRGFAGITITQIDDRSSDLGRIARSQGDNDGPCANPRKSMGPSAVASLSFPIGVNALASGFRGKNRSLRAPADATGCHRMRKFNVDKALDSMTTFPEM